MYWVFSIQGNSHSTASGTAASLHRARGYSLHTGLLPSLPPVDDERHFLDSGHARASGFTVLLRFFSFNSLGALISDVSVDDMFAYK